MRINNRKETNTTISYKVHRIKFSELDRHTHTFHKLLHQGYSLNFNVTAIGNPYYQMWIHVNSIPINDENGLVTMQSIINVLIYYVQYIYIDSAFTNYITFLWGPSWQMIRGSYPRSSCHNGALHLNISSNIDKRRMVIWYSFECLIGWYL